jgi:curved DNA-binding protein CbpA
MTVLLKFCVLFLLVSAILSVSDSLEINLPGGVVRRHILQSPFDQSTSGEIFFATSQHSRYHLRSHEPSQLQSTADANADIAPESTTKENYTSYGNSPVFDKTLYQVLQVDKIATREEIKKSYFRLAKQSHPDALIDKQSKQNNDNDNDDEATVDFQEIAEAWKILGNSKLRRRYDRELKAKEWSLRAQAYTNERLEQAVPVVADMMDNIAVPFLRRTTATTWAVGQAIALGVSGFSRIAKTMNGNAKPQEPSNNNRDDLKSQTTGIDNEILQNDFSESSVNRPTILDNEHHSDFLNEHTTHVSTVSEIKHHEPIGLTDTFLQALEVGRQAAREIESMELNEEAEQLQERFVIMDYVIEYCCSH